MLRIFIAITLCILAVFSHIDAQPANYWIRVQDMTNLRTSYSLDAPVAFELPAQTELHVVYEGINGFWLQVEYSGGKYWMARWLNYQHLAQGAQQSGGPQPSAPSPNAPPPEEIDNLCFISMVCTSEEDWIRGWHLYRAQEPATGISGSPPLPSKVDRPGNSYSFSGNGEKRLSPISLNIGYYYHEFVPERSYGYLDEAAVPDDCFWGLTGDVGFFEVTSEPCALHIAVANSPGQWSLKIDKVVGAPQLAKQNSYSWTGHNEERIEPISLTVGSWYHEFKPERSYGFVADESVPSTCVWGLIGDTGFFSVRSEPCTLHLAVANSPGSWSLDINKAG